MQRRGFLRNFTFGAEDSLVSTVGLLSGVSFAGLGSRAIIVSGVILILVEAISMAAGVYISEDSVNELHDGQTDNKSGDAITMLVSYLLVGLIPLLPYIFVDDTRRAFYISVAASLISLFALGLYKGFFVKIHPLISAVKVTLIGGFVIAIAIVVGVFVKIN